MADFVTSRLPAIELVGQAGLRSLRYLGRMNTIA
jgi:hypothetical protein